MTSIPVLADGTAGPWYRVLSITAPWRPRSAESDFVSVLPAALSAAVRGRPFAAGWLCRGAGSPLELITNAGTAGAAPREGTPPAGGSAVPQALLFPAGARGVPAGDGWLPAWDRLVWAPCAGRPAVPLAGERSLEPEREWRQPTLFESALAALLGRPFGWLVVAEPTDLLHAEVAALRTQVNVLRRHDEERSRFGTGRAERRLAELDAFGEAGLWHVRVLAGAATPEALALAAPALTGSLDLSHHPYRLVCGQPPLSLAGALATTAEEVPSGARVPFAATAGVLAALTGLPRQELPGLRIPGSGHFDLTSETGDASFPARNGTATGSGVAAAGGPVSATAAGGTGAGWRYGGARISLGTILDGLDRPVGSFQVPLSTLNRHAFVTGATGAGKSQTTRHLLEQLSAAGVPWLVIEPVKSEYAGVAGRLAACGQARPVTVINPADPAAVPLSVNPLAPEPGYPVQAHIDMVRALFLAAFQADEPFPQIMAQALQHVYEANGWDVVTGGRVPGAVAEPAIPTLAQLQRAAVAVIGAVGYGPELQADVRGFVDVRLRSLRIGSSGRFFEGGHPADVAELLRRNVVLAIEDVANDEDKAFLMGTLIIRIVEHLRLAARRSSPDGLRHVIVIEEAHRLLRAQREDRASTHAVELFAGLLAEIRAYGEGLVIAEQIPAKIIPDVIKNTALKVVHRLPARDDRELVGAAMNLDDDQSRQVVSLAPGVAAVFADGMDRPVRVAVPYGGGRERPLPGPTPPLLARRSPACGPRCAGERACTLLELREAEVLAAPASAQDAWLRLWAETLVLAFLTGRGMPAVPAPLRSRWREMDGRLRECLLATVIDRVTGTRAAPLRACYDPAHLTASVAGAALRMLERDAGAGTRAGAGWVIPQLRWLHELERVCPLGGDSPDPGRRADPLDFDLPGVADWPGMRVGHRVRALRGHPLSMDLPRNRWPAWTVLLGEDDQHAFTEDLAVVGVGLSPAARLQRASESMQVAWLEVVLSWPRRFVAAADWQQVAGSRPPGPPGTRADNAGSGPARARCG